MPFATALIQVLIHVNDNAVQTRNKDYKPIWNFEIKNEWCRGELVHNKIPSMFVSSSYRGQTRKQHSGFIVERISHHIKLRNPLSSGPDGNQNLLLMCWCITYKTNYSIIISWAELTAWNSIKRIRTDPKKYLKYSALPFFN